MGSTGKTNIQSLKINRTKDTEKITSKSAAMVGYFKQRTFDKLDIEPYLEPRFDKKGYITIDYARMPKVTQQLFNQVVQEGRVEVTEYGAWGKWLKLK